MFPYCLFITFQIAKISTEDKVANLFSVLIPIYAFSFTNTPFFLSLISRLSSYIIWNVEKIFSIPLSMSIPYEYRANILHKFSGDTAYPAGIAFFSLFLFGALRTADSKRMDAISTASLFLGAVCLGFCYPFMYLAIFPTIFLFIANDFFQKKFNKNDGWILLIVVLSVIILFPYFSSFVTAKKPEASIVLAISFKTLLYKLEVSVFTFIPIGGICWIFRKRLEESFFKKKQFWEVLSVSVIACLIMYCGLKAPLQTEYKYLALACYGTGILSGVCFAEMYKKNRLICFFF
jgi:hypothetical protein